MTSVEVFGELPKERIAEIETADLVVVACGYESRSRAFAESVEFRSADRVALVFGAQHELSFDENSTRLLANGYRLAEIEDDEVCQYVSRRILETTPRNGDELRVFVDISSQSRRRIAAIIEALAECADARPIKAYFGYTLAKFAAPPVGQGPTVDIGPISAFFAGWPEDPDLPVSVIMGLGHEPDRALGAVEYLEPADVWALLPRSSISEYAESLQSANDQLFKHLRLGRLVEYDVEDPNGTFALLSGLVAHLARSSSVLLLPSGPKILVLLSLLVACGRKDISVWRVSAGAEEPAIDREPSGKSFVVECQFAPEFDLSDVADDDSLS